MAEKEITFSGGIESPPKLRSVIIKPTSDGKMSYAQNMSVATDKYGNGVLLPGPYFATLSSNRSNPIYWKANDERIANGNLWLGYNGSNTFDRITSTGAGLIPAFDSANTITLTTTTTPGIADMISAQYQGADAIAIYVTMQDGSGNAYLGHFQSSDAGSTLTNRLWPITICAASSPSNPLPMVVTQFDGNIYIGNAQTIDKLNTNNATFSSGIVKGAVGTSSSGAIPNPWYITAMGEWNGLLVAAANNDYPGDFTKRNASGQSRVFFWDIANSPTGNYKTNFINSPSHYISVLFTDLSGNLLAFGGVDEGRSTIYQYNGYGFIPLFSYIGDLPRNRHSVCFDAQGRLMWQTANGEICRLNVAQILVTQANDEQSGAFEHLNTMLISTTANTGGILSTLQSLGSEFVASGGSYLTLSDTTKFCGNGGSYSTNTIPTAISGQQIFPQRSIIQNVIVSLNKALETGDSMDINYYPQGTTSLQGINLGNISYANDGAIASKQIRTFKTGVDEAAFGVSYLNADGASTATGVLKMNVNYKEITTL